ncbi:hypothetical protein A7D25_15120 [Pseudomonas sp. 21C1]|nr:hypothetical protein A7D25_15120 [Pseudomonas sp. 21C1]
MLDIVIAELIEGNYVLYQGDLSTEVLEKLEGPLYFAEHARTIMAWPWKMSNNADPYRPANAGLS